MKTQHFQNYAKYDKGKVNSFMKALKPHPSQISLTQSIFPSKKNSLRSVDPTKPQISSDFYQTQTFGFGAQWSRPQSKRASRKQSNRPQTSKGIRTMNCNRISRNEWKEGMGTSKSMHYDFMCEKENEDISNSQIRIVLNQREKCKKQKLINGNKFKTELPDEFLSLFAD